MLLFLSYFNRKIKPFPKIFKKEVEINHRLTCEGGGRTNS
jgi:hypothetical protein